MRCAHCGYSNLEEALSCSLCFHVIQEQQETKGWKEAAARRLQRWLTGMLVAGVLIGGLGHWASRVSGASARSSKETGGTSSREPAMTLASLPGDGRGALEREFNLTGRIPDNAVFEYYHVRGNSYQELCREMFDVRSGKGSLNAKEGKRYASCAYRSYRWNGRPERDGGAYRWQDIDVRLKTTIQFPVWEPPREADPRLVLKWNNFVGPLKEHELGHAELYDQMVDDFRTTMAGLSAGSEHDLRALTRQEFDAFIKRVAKVNEDFDARTGHGRSQGATF